MKCLKVENRFKPFFSKQTNLDKVWSFCEKEMAEGRQVFVIYPLVEESEALDLMSAEEGFNLISSIFPRRTIAMIHGRMSPDQKHGIMAEFAKKSTVVGIYNCY